MPGKVRLPALFVGHGSPMNALGDNEYARGWRSLVQDLPRPDAVLCVSAHWQTWGTGVSAAERPDTIHDFYGFPEELYRIRYPCPGAPDLAGEVAGAISSTSVSVDPDRGLDHGAWAVILHMYPEADVPVFQLSLDASRSPAFHYSLGRELAPLRDRGVMVVGSGNIVHNLHLADMSGDGDPYDWAVAFDSLARDLIDGGRHGRLVDYVSLGPAARMSIPTNEHYLPLLYVLALQREGEPVTYVNERIALRSVSMRSLRIG
ncbi:MAG: 4,5-DOPA dioxygenase extradiol [bacterium]|nr:MAG: 4,5-DOPA dioxygenase extradiol [bacterium]